MSQWTYRNILRLFICISVGAFLSVGAASAQSLSTSVIGLFPKQTSTFAYADLKSGKKITWFMQLQDQLVPERLRQFQQFLTSAGLDTTTQVDALCWGSIVIPDGGGVQFLGVALGEFDPFAIGSMLKQEKLPVTEVHGFDLYAFGTGSGPGDIFFTFIDSSTAAFGQRAALERLIDVRTGALEGMLSNDKIFPAITEANGNGLIWAVLDHSYTRIATDKILPKSVQVRQVGSILDHIKGIAIKIEAGDDDVTADFQAVCNSPDDANLLGAAIQAGLLYQRYQDSQQSGSNSDFEAAIDRARVVPSGDRLRITFSMTQQEVLSMIAGRVFSSRP